jgi:hypothetical protein
MHRPCSFRVFYQWFLKVTPLKACILQCFIDVTNATKTKVLLANTVFYEGLVFNDNSM